MKTNKISVLKSLKMYHKEFFFVHRRISARNIRLIKTFSLSSHPIAFIDYRRFDVLSLS